MAGELRVTDATGLSVYAVIFSGATVWTGSNTFAAATATLMNSNTVGLTEIAGTGIYVGNFPTGITSAGRYSALFYQQSTGQPAVTVDSKIGSSPQLDWNGTSISTIAISLPAVAPGSTGGLPTGDSSGNVGIKSGAIDLAQLSSTFKALSLRVYLVSTGTTSPVTADTYYVNGLYGGIIYYTGVSTSETIWTDGTYWYITPIVGTVPNSGTSYFKTASGATSVGPYILQVNGGSGSGVPTIVAHGNAILAAFQPEGPVAANMTQVAGTSVSSGILQSADITAMANAIYNYAVETGISFQLAVQKIGAVCAGNYVGTDTGGTFQSLGGSTTRVATSISGTNRTNV